MMSLIGSLLIMISLTTATLCNQHDKRRGARLPVQRLEPSKSQALQAAEVLAVIRDLQKKGEDWSPAEIDYILKNINRPELAKALKSWQESRKVKLTKKARINISIEYLLTELSGIRTLAKSLDQFEFGRPDAIWAQHWRAAVGATTFSSSRYGRLKFEAIPRESEVYLNGDFAGYSETEFVAPVGSLTIVIKKKGYFDFASSAQIEDGKKTLVECKLTKRN